LAMFHMSNDSGLFATAEDIQASGQPTSPGEWATTDVLPSEIRVPLYEAKMVHHFDHRWTTFDRGKEHPVPLDKKRSSSFEPMPRYWVPQGEVADRLQGKSWSRKWLLGWRDIVGSEGRTLIPCVCPSVGVGDKFLLALSPVSPELNAALYGCLCSLVCDYVAKQKVGGSSLKNFVFKQLAVIPPSFYTSVHLDFIVPRVLELSYTSYSMRPFAQDLGYAGEPFLWNADRRALLKSELDAWYARAYGLTRDELCYILDPSDVMGAKYPSETFRVLKKIEIKLHREYRTRRLVLEAWDRIERGDLPCPEPYDRNSATASTQTVQQQRKGNVANGQGQLLFAEEPAH